MSGDQGNLDAERMALGQRIREARDFVGLSQEQVASVLGISRPAVGNIEKGERRVEAIELNRLAALFGTTVDFLLKGPKETEAEGEQLAFLARATKGLSQSDMEQLMRFTEYLRNTSNTSRRG